MTTYDVRLHREILITFRDIEADSPEDAASTARGYATNQIDRIDDCDDLSARVDVTPGDVYHPPVFIDFEGERCRKAAPQLLAALKYALEFLEANDDSEDDITSRISAVRAAIAEAEAAGMSPSPSYLDIHEILAERRQIAHIWSIEDVQGIRPDLSEDQCWEVLQHVDHYKDAELGITWLTLKMAAKHLFGDAPDTDESEGE
jgi:hypothetical protein